ncbi:MAG: FixH family protein [Bacteroidota bacterium]|nr:FixH family protein [Bacteroidota bacterium]
MNWGNKLIIVFILFAGIIGTMVYKAINTKVELVSKDYYKEELRYQDRIDGRNNAAQIGKVAVTQNAESVEIAFPAEMKGLSVSGEAWFYCQTDDIKDRKIPLQVDENGRQLILKKELAKGSYDLKLNWEASSKQYYTEQKLIIQ